MVRASGVCIRRRVPSDDPALAVIGRLAFSEYSPNAEAETRSLARRVPTLVATLEGKPVAFAVVGGPAHGGAHLAAIAVLERHRGAGIGRRLLSAAEDLAVAHGARELTLVTAESNVAALALFFRSGFRLAGRQPRYYARGQTGIRLAKRLERSRFRP